MYTTYLLHMSVTYDRSMVSSTNKTYLHEIAEMLLKVALNAMTITITITFSTFPN